MESKHPSGSQGNEFHVYYMPFTMKKFAVKANSIILPSDSSLLRNNKN